MWSVIVCVYYGYQTQDEQKNLTKGNHIVFKRFKFQALLLIHIIKNIEFKIELKWKLNNFEWIIIEFHSIIMLHWSVIVFYIQFHVLKRKK